jgi:hypothetical protein
LLSKRNATLVVRLQVASGMGSRGAISWLMLALLACDGSADPAGAPQEDDPRPPDVDRGTVGMGIARLSARHVAALLKVISNDTSCGFASDAVKGAVQLSGQPGDDGTATWNVSGCKVSFAKPTKIDTDCDGHDLLVRGAATITATRTLHGVLQKDLSQPVAPDAATSATITLQEVKLEGFLVQQTGTDSWLTVNTGTLSVTAVPQLAPDHKSGICTVATPHVTMHTLNLADADTQVIFQGQPLRVKVPSATLELQVGLGPEHENWFEGQLVVWETRVKVPVPSDPAGLDPNYTPAGFIESFACNADLQHPLGGTCPPPRERPAQGVAALSVQLFAAVARQLDKDTQCGFSKSGFAGAPAGATGDQGSMVWTLPTPCTLSFAPGTVVDTDCNGKQTLLEGSVSITGKKTLAGYLVGDPAEPVVPTTTTPVVFDLVLTPHELRVSSSGSQDALVAHSGTLNGTLQPMTGLDTTTNVCSIATPIAHLTFAHQGFAADIDTGDTSEVITIDSSMLEAQTGSSGGKTNYLEGQMASAGHALQVPSAGAQPVLDPAYDASTFQQSFMCNAKLHMPASDADCKLTRKLGEAAARLMVKDAAAAMKLLNDNAQCGFQDQDILKNGFNVISPAGYPGQVSWATNYCPVGTGSQQPWTTDCDNVTTTIEGVAYTSGIRTVRGIRYDIDCGLFCDDIPAVNPAPEDCADFSINMQLANFAAGTPDGRLIIHAGTIATTAHPMQGKNVTSGWYDIGTPIARFDNIDYSGGSVTLVTGPKTFNLTLGSAHLAAFNGAFKGDSNRLSGPINVDGVDLMLGMLKLNPDYDQMKFDHSYACTPNLAATLPP